MREVVLGIVWIGAAVAIVMKFLWVGAPKWLSAVTGLALGWAGVAAMPQVARHAGATAVILRRSAVSRTPWAPSSMPSEARSGAHIFGYHELFHALTLVAVTCQYVAIAFFVVKVG